VQRVEPHPNKKETIHRRDTEYAEFGILSVKNSLLGVLSASAVIFQKHSQAANMKFAQVAKNFKQSSA
jgi:hypothetical protein